MRLAKRRSFWMVAIGLATIVAYAPAIGAPFVFDDIPTIEDDSAAHVLSATGAPLTPRPGSALAGRPVVGYTFALNYAINRGLGIDQRPWPNGPNKTVVYRVTNIVLHLACGFVLFGLMARTIAGQRFNPTWAARADEIAAALAAVWLLHPIQTDALNYIVQRTEIMVSLFYLTTLFAAIKASDATSSQARAIWSIVAVLACLLGVGSKEVIVTVPVIVLLWDRVFRFDDWQTPWKTGRWRIYAALAATTALLAISASSRGRTAGFGAGVGWLAYLRAQAWAVPHYVRLILWPRGLVLDYGSARVGVPNALPGFFAIGTALAISLAAWLKPARWGWFAFLAAWWFLLLAPSSSVVPIATEVAAERRVYLASIAVIILAAVIAESVLRRVLQRRPFARAAA